MVLPSGVSVSDSHVASSVVNSILRSGLIGSPGFLAGGFGSWATRVSAASRKKARSFMGAILSRPKMEPSATVKSTPMLLSAGTCVGPYVVLAPIGAGGMGQVYRARDTKLGREVALKILAPALAGDSDYLSRFQR